MPGYVSESLAKIAKLLAIGETIKACLNKVVDNTYLIKKDNFFF